MDRFGPGILLLALYVVAPLIEVVASVVYYQRQRNLPGLGLVVGSVGGLVVFAVSLYGPVLMGGPPSPGSTLSTAFTVSTYVGVAFGILFAVSLLAVMRTVARSPQGAEKTMGDL